MRRLIDSAAIAGLLLLLGAGQDATEPRREPGLVLTLRAQGQPGHAQEVRRLRLAAFAIGEGEPASARLGAGRFTAELGGYVNVPLRDRYTFSCEATGACEIEIGGQVVLALAEGEGSKTAAQPARLAKGANRLRVRFTSPARGEARLRVFWQSDEVPREPLPPSVLTHDAAALGDAELARLGREVVTARRCLRCHAAPAETADELKHEGPDLTDVGARLRRDWLARWIAEPRALRPDATMPRVLAGDADARDVAAYLATHGKPSPGEPGDAAKGGVHFAQLGCIACHPRPEAVPAATDSRVSLHFSRAKWQPAALADFLRRPSARHAATAMPDLALGEGEARDLAAFLLAGSGDVPAAEAGGDPARGRSLVETSGCLACHQLAGAKNRATAKPWSEVAAGAGRRGCGTEGAASPPIHVLTARERDALAALAAAGHSALRATSSAESAERLVTRLRCTACHVWDGRADDWTRLAGEVTDLLPRRAEGETDKDAGKEVSQDRPALTWCGDKLRSPWLRSFLKGQLDWRPRPWLAARMPVYAAHTDVLADGLARSHGLAPVDPPAMAADPALTAIGRQLVGPKGFTCVLCHAVGDQPATAVFESFGVDFSRAAERLRHEWFQRWMLNPQRLEPRTRMPLLPDEKGRTDFREVLDGSAARQFDAIWHWLQGGRAIEPPRGQ